MAILLCEVCGEQMYSFGYSSFTCVGYFSPAGHDHDDNCVTKNYRCENGHNRIVSVINKCPACDWKGITWCNTGECPGEKFEEWPEE